MKDPSNLAGAEPADQRLWNSYVFWARSAFGAPPRNLIIADPAVRISSREDNLLHALVFATFALEYRLRSVYELLSLVVRRRAGVWELLNNLERRTAGMNRKGRPIVFPQEWKSVRTELQKLLTLRNRIAHGQRGSVASLLTATQPTLQERTETGYNAVIDAIRIINVAISYDTRPKGEVLPYYSQLKVGTK